MIGYSLSDRRASHLLSSDNKNRHCRLFALRTGCPGRWPSRASRITVTGCSPKNSPATVESTYGSRLTTTLLSLSAAMKSLPSGEKFSISLQQCAFQYKRDTIRSSQQEEWDYNFHLAFPFECFERPAFRLASCSSRRFALCRRTAAW